jgi:ferritin-like metal-binding protein YciE
MKNSLLDLYISELQDLYDAEKQLTKALPKMAEKASTPALSQAFEDHLQETITHVERIESILEDLGEKPGKEKCPAMKGLIAEGERTLKERGDDTVRDAGIVVAAQKVEHYEIAAYGSLCNFAKILGRNQDLEALRKTIKEEKAADQTLTRIAESEINLEAAAHAE